MHGIILHEEYRERMKKLSPEDLGKLIHNMFRVDEGEKLEVFGNDYLDLLSETVCGRLGRDIEKSDKQRINRLGKTKEKPNDNQNKTKPKPKDNQTKTPITNNQLPITNNQLKRQYGECQNVLLTDEEYQKLVDQGLTGLIEELSLYIAGKGDKYKSHYAVIRQWANRRKEEKKVKPNNFTLTATQREYNFDDLERKLVKN